LPRRPSSSKAPSNAPPAADSAAATANARVFASAGDAPGREQAQRDPPLARPAKAARPNAPRAAMLAARAALSGLALDDWHRRLSREARYGSAITYAIAGSLLIHAMLLALRFQLFDPRKMADRGPPLEVALVNARSTLKPTKADILAQANLDGGGNTDAERRAKNPLPLPPRNTQSADLALTTQRAQDLERRAQDLMTQLKAGTASVPPKPEPAPAPEKTPAVAVADATQRTLEVMRLEAQIARDMDAYQKLPKRRQVGVRAEEYRFARYVEDWRQKVERVGNLNYPEAARQLKLYGNLILTVSIRADGSVEKVVIERSSGQRVLDAAAIRIVEMAAPYSTFPAEIRRDTEILDITRTWTFARGDELRSD
jgi:protein TonB